MRRDRSTDPVDLIGGLTERELEVLALMVEGLRRVEIAEMLGVSPNTVRTHAQNLQAKLGVHSDVAAVSIALGAGLRPGNVRREATYKSVVTSSKHIGDRGAR